MKIAEHTEEYEANIREYEGGYGMRTVGTEMRTRTYFTVKGCETEFQCLSGAQFYVDNLKNLPKLRKTLSVLKIKHEKLKDSTRLVESQIDDIQFALSHFKGELK